MSTHPLEQEELLEETSTQEPTKVILFNDDVHTFEEVTSQLVKALRCPHVKAEALTWEVHNSGKAVVYAGELSRCMEVSGVLQEIELMTQIEV
ncbi:MAG: ATP-dependent Clp protease adaptor ClpS [Bacteroidetes bacterium]|nr:ATP-dependent Clp protease adaptor ClpS [Bacteroidota bacterium]